MTTMTMIMMMKRSIVMARFRLPGKLAFAAQLVVATPVLAQGETPYRYYGHMWGDGYGWHSMGYGLMFVFWIVVIALIVLAVRWVTERNGGNSASALDILKERLARGEIEPAEYEERRKVLEK